MTDRQNNLLRIDTLHLRNFRQFENAAFKFHPHFNVLIGKNGKGKTTVLDALAIMLNTYFQGSAFKSSNIKELDIKESRISPNGSAIKDEDARFVYYEQEDGTLNKEDQTPVLLAAYGAVHDENCHWKRALSKKGASTKDFVKLVNSATKLVKEGKKGDLPLISYYGTGRLWDAHNDRERSGPESRLNAYDFCIDPKSDHKNFEKWLWRLTWGKRQKKEERPALEAVKQSVLECVPGSTDFMFSIEDDSIMLKLKDKGWVPFHSLSDGYRNITAIAADIAHRAAKLNPHHMAEAAAKAQGVVLIDELDLHLHPEWQRKVVGCLQKAFPHVQFITASHSPFILQSVADGQVIDLDRVLTPDDLKRDMERYPEAACPWPRTKDKETSTKDISEDMMDDEPMKAEYQDKPIEDITEDVMGVGLPQMSKRRQDMRDKAQQYYEILQQGKDASEEEKARLSAELDELTAPFSDDVAYHAFLEMERIAAGFPPSKRKET